jgi:hypothetical protein
MSLTIFQNAFGRNYTFKLYERDGITPRPLAGLTLVWRFKNVKDGTDLEYLNCVITDPTNGQFYATMTTDITSTIRSFITQIEISQTGVLLDPSEEFIVNIEKSAAVSG